MLSLNPAPHDPRGALGQSIRALPGTLATTRTTLNDVATLSDALGPTATALLPTARRLPSTLRDARTLFESAAGSSPRAATSAVIMIGRSLSSAALRVASTIPAPASRNSFGRERADARGRHGRSRG